MHQFAQGVVVGKEDKKLLAEDIKQSQEDSLLKSLQEKQETKEEAEVQVKSLYKIPYNSLEVKYKLGEGKFRVVYLGTWGHENVAIKIINKTITEEDRKAFEAQVQVIAKLRSKYIVQFYGYCLSPLSLVMKHMPKGSLNHLLLNKKVVLDVDIRTRFMTEIACGLSVLHAENILHKDITSLRMLVDDHLHVKLSDFGLSLIDTSERIQHDSFRRVVPWLAPELLCFRHKYTKKSDIYSLGMTFWEIAARSLPYAGFSQQQMIQNVVQKGMREPMPDDCPKRWATVIEACWKEDPNKRPESDDIVAFFKSGQEDFQTFLPIFRATQANQNNLSSANLNNLSSANPGAPGMPGSPGIPASGSPSVNFSATSENSSSENSSFNRELMGNLASRR